jgi:hypothetical protein
MQEKNKNRIKNINENIIKENNNDREVVYELPEYIQNEIDGKKPLTKTQKIIVYIAILFFSFQFTVINFILLASTLNPNKNAIFFTYIFIGLFSLFLGAVTGFLLNKVSNDRFFLLGNIAVSFFNATIMSLILIIFETINSKLSELNTEKLIPFFNLNTSIGVANSLFIPLLIIICFNIVPYYLYEKREKKSVSSLKYYLIAFAIFIIIYLVVPELINSFIESSMENGLNYSMNYSSS